MKCTKLLILIWACVSVVIFILWWLNSLAFTSTTVAVRMFSQYLEGMSAGAVCTDGEANQNQVVTTKPKLILFYRFPDYYELAAASGTKIFHLCARQCELTVNDSRFAEADVVVFYSHAHIVRNADSTPLTKQPGQIWVFFAVESPPYSQNVQYGQPEWHGVFNWTMTYRYDSDLWHGYLRAVPRAESATEEEKITNKMKWREMFHGKTKMIAWFVSHCSTDSRREHYVSLLSQHIQIDIYGKCGTEKCDRSSNLNCLEMVRRDYKYYLSFENSLCKDYVTEKLKDIFSIGGVIPIVRGGADYHKLFPPNSVIDTSNFSSVHSLAQHLKSLAADEEAYITMLQWNWDYEIKGPHLPLCETCERLYDPKPKSCIYHNIYDWWAEGMCHRPRDL